MRLFLKIGLFLIILNSCISNDNKTSVEIFQPQRDYLSTWFLQNEDSLYSDYLKYAKRDSLCVGCERVFYNADSSTYIGKFTLQAKLYCDSIEIAYFYKNDSVSKPRILISAQYNKKCVPVLDSILVNPNSKYFQIDKYEQPSASSGFLYPEGMIEVADLRVVKENQSPPYNIRVLIKGKGSQKFLDKIEEDLKRSLFGEEILLKGISSIRFQYSDSIDKKLQSLEDFRKTLE